MKNKIINIFLVLFILVNVGYLIYKNKKGRGNSLKNEARISNKTFKINNIFLRQENWKDTVSLTELTEKAPCLVLRVPKVSCQQCKFIELDMLKQLSMKDSKLNVCAILTVDNPREMKYLSLNFDYNFLKLGSLEQNVLKIPEEMNKKPYYFLLNKNLEGCRLFFPDPTKTGLTKKYLDETTKNHL